MKFKSFNHLLLSGIWILGCLNLSHASAQNTPFDPLLDPGCNKVSKAVVEEWNSNYIWYPGLLSAHLQKIQKKKSEMRCVNVGYPGKFMKATSQTFFRKEVKLTQQTQIQWNTTGEAKVTIDGQDQAKGLNSITLQPGKHTLLFDITNHDKLPALIIKGKGVEEIKGWQVSLDNNYWNIPETDVRYNKPSVSPDEDQDITVSISPDNYVLLRNSRNNNGKLQIGENGSLMVDFRHLEVGNVIVEVTGSGKLSFTVGESPEETLNENTKYFEQFPIAPYTLTGKTQEIVLPERALRYMKISSDRPCTISSIRFEAKMWPVEFLMQFESDNKAINDLFNAGVATLHTSMHNFYLDGVKRDYLPWAMDAIVSSLGGDYVFGDRQVSRSGISIALMPPNPQASDWGIVDYPLHALVGIKQDYMRFGDLSTTLMFKDRIIQQMSLYESVQDVNGFFKGEPPTTGFIPGWSRKMGPEDYGIATYGQMMLYQNFKIGAYLAKLWRDNALAKRYEDRANKLGESIITHFWDNEKKAFINGYRQNGDKDDRVSHHAQYWGVLTGLYPEEHYDHLYDYELPSIPFYKGYISYEKGYECLAYIKAGRIKDMFTLLNEVWGDWLRQGNTRFPENFSLGAPLQEQLVFYERPYGLSLCHGANGVPPIVAVLHGIYGFYQSDENITEYTLKPNLMDMNWAKGRIPVKEGFIQLELNKTGISTVEIPDNCIVKLFSGQSEKPLIIKKAGKYNFQLK